MWYVYILECQDGRLYTGATTDIERRYKQHARGQGGRFTRTFGVQRMVYQEEYPTREEALSREAQIKSWSRERKCGLINADESLITRTSGRKKR